MKSVKYLVRVLVMLSHGKKPLNIKISANLAHKLQNRFAEFKNLPLKCYHDHSKDASAIQLVFCMKERFAQNCFGYLISFALVLLRNLLKFICNFSKTPKSQKNYRIKI